MSTSDKPAESAGADDGSTTDASPDADGEQSAPAESAEAAQGSPAEGAPGEVPQAGETPAPGATPPRATAAGRVWVALTVGVVLIVLLIIFIAENAASVRLSFLGAHGRISLGLAMLAAAVVGAIITLLVGTTRILQLRREVRRSMRHL